MRADSTRALLDGSKRQFVHQGLEAIVPRATANEAKAYDYTKEVMSQNAMASDAQEGIGAFLEKRRPVWCVR
jgi:enoyl-CoA hydratase/carnithine racemase